ncbi:MAG: glycosyltransferase [Sulfuriferula sp.]|nr:glycosyltransferase [Sulfuriferula sp.]
MKVLALGALWVPYIRDNWFDAIPRVLGDEVVCVNAGPLLAGKEKHAGQPEGFHCAYIYELLRRDKFDYLFFYHDWIFGDFPDAFFEKVRLAGVKTVAFHPDDEPEHWYARNATYDHHFDVVASHSSAGVARRRQQGWGDRVMYLPWGYNPATCYAMPDMPKRYDVVFIGKHKVNDTQGKVHVEDGAQREQILVRLAEACEQRGWTFRVFGYGWDRHPQLARFAGGIPTQEEMVRILNETRVVFNPAWSSDGNPDAVQTKLRHFEVPGCGAFQLTNANPELAELFKPDEEVVFYDNDEDLLQKVEKFVSDDHARNAIAAAGHARALREHTLDHRVDALFAHMRTLYPPQPDIHAAPTAVKRLDLENAAALTQLRRDLGNDATLLADADWVHLVAGDFLHVKTDYAVLEPFFHGLPSHILAVGTFIDFDGLASNPLQPKLMESEGCVLAGEINIEDYDLPLLDTQGGSLIGVRMEDHAALLMNYLAPRHRVTELLDAFAAGTLEAIHQLEAIQTGRIVTEVLLPIPEGYEFASTGIRNSEYVRRLRALLPRFREMNWRVVIYGISGMGEVVMKLIEQIHGLKPVGIVDRSLNVAEFQDIPVIKPTELQALRPDVIILTSGSSGPSIYANIAHLEAVSCILPLYDLNHPVWSVMQG